MDVRSCHFREEQAFLSALPLVSMEKGLFERGKRNLLTGGAASCYPFTSFEMCDDNGILLGVNKYNSSLIIVDIFQFRDLQKMPTFRFWVPVAQAKPSQCNLWR